MILEQCHSAEKCKRGDPLEFSDIHCVLKYQTNKGGNLWCNPKSFKKSRIVPKKSEGGGLGEILSVLSRFC